MAQDKQIIKTLEQKIICDCLHPRLIIEANAGAAKTTTAAMKIARLIADGLDPRKIIALSFSDPGVIAFRKAFQRVGIPPKTANAIWVGTFEEFCAVRLEEYEGFSVQPWTKPEEVRAFVLAAIPQARAWALAKYDTPLSIEGTGELVLQPHLTWALCTSSAVVAAHGSGLALASPAGPGQHLCRVRWCVPQQTNQEASHLCGSELNQVGNRPPFLARNCMATKKA